MTMFKPTLQVRRLKIRRGNATAYDEKFHSGVNILRGQNSSGKTAVLDFIAYSLGGENIPWKQEALLCDSAMVEILANGVQVTLRRPVNDKAQNPMLIFWGGIDHAETAPISSWEVYPFRRSERKESFSQVVFRALEMPEVRGAAESNITMHQLLRLLYADQRSPHDTLFRPETFDTTLTRETVGGYLFGIYDDKLYEAQLALRGADAELGRVVSELRSIFSVLGRSGQETNFEWIGSEIAGHEREQLDLSLQLEKLKNQRASQGAQGNDPGVSELRRRLSVAKKKLADAEDRKAGLELEIRDSEQFISELQRRSDSLTESGAARAYLGSVSFSFCPCCLSPVRASDGAATHCSLCKSPFGERAADSQLLRLKNELELQREESTRLLSARRKELTDLTGALPSFRNELASLQREYSRQSTSWNSAIESEIEGIARKIGETDQRIKQLLEAQRLGSVVLDLQKKREQLATKLQHLNGEIERLTFAQEKRKEEAKAVVAEQLVQLLRHDLPRQAEFSEAKDIDWSFGDNRVIVNGHINFSESSMVILRHSFHLAMLFGSTKEPFFRVPRLVILDGIDDGGLEIGRNHHYQRLIVEISSAVDVEHQIIFATSHIEPSLDTPQHTIGRNYTTERKSLEIA